MVDRPTDDSGDGGTADEGKILSPHELDITESEYVEEIDEGRYVVSPDSRKGGNARSSTQGSRGGGQGGEQSGASGGQSRTSTGAPSGEGGGRLSGSSGHSRSGRQPGQGESSGHSGELSEQAVRRWLRQKYEHNNSKYAFDVTAQFDGVVSQRQMASNDLITVFESLMLWYAQQVDSSMPVEEVLGILLMESNVPVRYPPESVKNLIRSTDLGPNDTIADLLETVQEKDGVQL